MYFRLELDSKSEIIAGRGKMGINIESIKSDITEAAERMGMDYEDLAEMIPEVLEDCQTKAASLKDAIAAGDAAQVKALAHDLKGSTANYGLKEASGFAKTLEENFENPNVADQASFATLIDEIIALDLS